MTLALLLVLAGSVAAPGSDKAVADAGAHGLQPAPTQQPGPSTGSFKTPPLEASRRALKGPRRLPKAPASGVASEEDAISIVRTLSASSRVECTMRVLQADPSIDPAFVIRTPDRKLDRIVRDELSPCLPSR